MGVIGVLLLVVFVIVAFLLIGLVLIQGESGDGLGGLFGGASNSAFGSRSGNILTRATYVLGGLFFVTCFFVALLNRTSDEDGLEKAAREAAAETQAAEWWNEDASDIPSGALDADLYVSED